MKKRKKNNRTIKANMRILKSGKIKVYKNSKISFSPQISYSLENLIIGRLDAIPSKEEVVIDSVTTPIPYTNNIISAERFLGLNKLDFGEYTIAAVVNKSTRTKKVFDINSNTIIGKLMRTSTLTAIFNKYYDRRNNNLVEEWGELNTDDNTAFTNILYVPQILVFLDDTTGKILRQPYKVNLLIVAVPDKDNLAEGIEAVHDVTAIRKYIEAIVDAGLKCGAKNLVIEPFCNKIFESDLYTTSDVWRLMIGSQRVMDGFNTIDFCINNDDQFIVFNSAMHGTSTINSIM